MPDTEELVAFKTTGRDDERSSIAWSTENGCKSSILSHRNIKVSSSRQQGFFTIGVGLTLLAIYGTIGTGILTAHQSTLNEGEQLVVKETPVYN